MNPEKLLKLQSQVRIGGKGSARRKKKIVRKVTTTDDKKIQSTLKKLGVNGITGIEEVNMIKEDGKVLNFNNPTVQASLAANTFAISGAGEEKHFTDLLPSILNHLGSDGFNQLKKHASTMAAQGFGGAADDDEIPELVGDFEAASKADAPAKKVEKGEEADDEDDEDSTPAPEKTKTKKASKKNSKKAASVDSDEDSTKNE